MRIGIDVDQVLAGFGESFVGTARAMGFNVPWPIPDWDFGMKKDDFAFVFKEICAGPAGKGFWENLPVIIDGLDKTLLLKCCRENEVYFITTRSWEGSQQVTAKWLQKKLGIPAPSVIVSEHKGTVANALLLDRHLDDNVGNAFDMARSLGTKSYLLKTSYTESFPEYHTLPELKKKITEVKSVAEYLQSVI